MRGPDLLRLRTHVPLYPPPVSNHFSEDSEDFIQRVRALDIEELTYIADLIQKGEESLGCLPVEDVEALVHHIRDSISPEIAQKVIAAYETGYSCNHDT